jgi:aerobic-type carbon monoxide dehydrogenase small subunit (CoxS/CutS family)
MLRAYGAKIITVVGQARDGILHPGQEAFIKEGAVQCSYCTPGYLMSGAKLLEEKKRPTVEEISRPSAPKLWRCTGYNKSIQTIQAIEHAPDANG